MRFACVGLAGCLLLLICGCNRGVETKGTVSFDGAPIPEGYIAFVPKGKGLGGGGNIVNGAYSVKTEPGKFRVEITASKLMPLPPGQVGMEGERELVQQYLPNKYNVKSELSADVPSKDPVPFDLKSK